MIGSFKDADAEGIFNRRNSRHYGVLSRVVLRKLLAIEAADTVDKLKSPPGNHLESLGGDRKGQHSIRVNDQYRICFVWRKESAHDIEITDYH